MCDSVADRAWKRSRSVSLYNRTEVLHNIVVVVVVVVVVGGGGGGGGGGGVCVCVCVCVCTESTVYSLPVGRYKLSLRSKSFGIVHHIVS
jgi:hypothetical protein